ncbi:MAG: YbjQ family protein [Candidatus Micrarchaeaceae archaeon]
MSILLTTENFLPDYQITDRLGIVYGVSVQSRNEIGNWLGSIRAAFGGSQKGYEKMITQNRDNAVQKLVEDAEALGADAVIGLRFDSSEFDTGKGQSMNEVVAYGTAVKITKNTQTPQSDQLEANGA